MILRTNPSTYATSGALISSDVPRNEANFQLEVLQVLVDDMGMGELNSPFLTDAKLSQEVSCLIKQHLPNQQSNRNHVHVASIDICCGV